MSNKRQKLASLGHVQLGFKIFRKYASFHFGSVKASYLVMIIYFKISLTWLDFSFSSFNFFSLLTFATCILISKQPPGPFFSNLWPLLLSQVFISEDRRHNLTLVSNVCEAASRFLLWGPNGLNESTEVHFQFPFILIGKPTMAFLTGHSWHLINQILVHRWGPRTLTSMLFRRVNFCLWCRLFSVYLL